MNLPHAVRFPLFEFLSNSFPGVVVNLNEMLFLKQYDDTIDNTC